MMRKRQEENQDFEDQPRQRISFKQSEAAGRKAVVILFLVTVGLSLIFWLKKDLPGFLRNITKPYEMTIEKGLEVERSEVERR